MVLFWKHDWVVSFIGKSAGHIDVSISSPDGLSMRLTGFYGNPVNHLRRHSWYLLRRISTTVQGGWIVIGDFNETMWASEEIGIRERPSRQMELFRNALTDCGLSCIPFSGYPFTWSNRHDDDTFVEACLDRGLVNAAVFAQLNFVHC